MYDGEFFLVIGSPRNVRCCLTIASSASCTLVPFDRLYHCKTNFIFPGHVLIDEGAMFGWEAVMGSPEDRFWWELVR